MFLYKSATKIRCFFEKTKKAEFFLLSYNAVFFLTPTCRPLRDIRTSEKPLYLVYFASLKKKLC
jgi:hypothetical protein